MVNPAAGPIFVVFTPDTRLRGTVETRLKLKGSPEIVFPADLDECVTNLLAKKDAILVIDWAVGAKEVNRVLRSIKGDFHVETRPILLLVQEVTTKVIATGYEYGVSQIHVVESAVEALDLILEILIREHEVNSTIRVTMTEVADLRVKGDWDGAEAALHALQREHPDNPRVAMDLAENYFHADRWQEALEAVKPFINLKPPYIRAMHIHARCLMKQGLHDEAIDQLKKAKIINPHNYERLIDLGNALLETDQLGEAKDTFKEAMDADDHAKEAKTGLGTCLLISGEVNEALTLLKEASGPRELASIFNTSAILSIRAGRQQEGMNLYEKALSLVSTDRFIASRLHFNMGLGYRRWSKNDKSAECFAKALELDPANAKAQRQKLIVEAMLGLRAPSEIPAEESFDESEFTEERVPAKDSSMPMEIDLAKDLIGSEDEIDEIMEEEED